MRITGGRWRSRRLQSVKGLEVRPTSDRAREALFNILRREVPGAEVVDCCCGTGALGLEALSHGARFVHFVDLAPASLRATTANLDACGADRSQYAVHRADAGRWLAAFLADGPHEHLVILADPPYGGPVPAALLEALRPWPAPAVVVIEHPAGQPPELPDPARWSVDQRRYGHSAFTILRPVAADQPEDAHG
jgi:16S rRNA (guanine966-N2)-methyltransferase